MTIKSRMTYTEWLKDNNYSSQHTLMTEEHGLVSMQKGFELYLEKLPVPHGIQPLGFYVLVEMDELENISAGGIVLATHTEHLREQNACDVGTILSFGPRCFEGFTGCEGPKDWGVAVGDRVEYERYEGKASRYNHDGTEAPENERRLRFIPDSKIIGKVS